MRCLSIVIIVVTLGSCSALKPVANNKTAADTPGRNSHPGLIENSNITPASTTIIQNPHISNTTAGNTFKIQHNIPEALNPIQFKYAILMDVPVEALANLKLFAFIEDWYGTPYHFGGSSKDGTDCSAFAGNLMTTVYGIGLPRMARDQYKVCEHVKKSRLEEGDLVFFHTTRKGISHVGVYLGNNKFVHASRNYGVTISDLTDPYYARSFRGGGRARQTGNAPEN